LELGLAATRSRSNWKITQPGNKRRQVSTPMLDTKWWQRAVIYQIYPRSFQDSSGDGIGDLHGITRRLRHAVDLGIDAVWLSPIFTSPMEDFGYDVADYCSVDPLFGSMRDFDELIDTAHSYGLKL
jgi:alpha-glucosidase